MSKTILVLGAGPYNIAVFQQLRKAGYRIAAIDRNPKAESAAYADSFACIDITDVGRAQDFAGKSAIDGVMPINDFGVPTAARISASLGLIGITDEAAYRATDKGAMREAWKQNGLPIPDFRIVLKLEEAVAAGREIGYPVIVKPAFSGGGGRGITIARDSAELLWAFNFALQFARTRRVLVESFIEGLEMTIDALTFRGKTTCLAMSDKVKPEMKYRVATRLSFPPALPTHVLQKVAALVSSAVDALGIEYGASHTEVIVTNSGPILVETGARGGGGHIFSLIVKEVTGVNYVVQTARILTNETPNLAQLVARGCVYGFFHPPAGIIKAIRGIDAARAIPGLLDIGLMKSQGQLVEELTDSLHRVGFYVVSADSRETAIERADQVEKTVRFEIEPNKVSRGQQP